VVPQVCGSSVHKSGEAIDERSSLVEVPVLRQVVGKAEVHRGSGHEVYGGGTEHLDGGHLGDISGGAHPCYPRRASTLLRAQLNTTAHPLDGCVDRPGAPPGGKRRRLPPE
jgi:hypothetical protein